MDDHDVGGQAEREPADRVTQSEAGFKTAEAAGVQHDAFFDLPLELTPEEQRAMTPGRESDQLS